LEAIRDKDMRIVGYRQAGPDGQVNIRDKDGQLVGWTALGQTRNSDGTVASFQAHEGLLYGKLR
jgi:hypothetical protein